ncbi:MAG: response regulator transcription factor [Opitutales bacterium]|nr:response regulator transcription factor [Opitutales bacterium]MCH8541396.1 response regulator transcription factor [Opitutales bacterium]
MQTLDTPKRKARKPSIPLEKIRLFLVDDHPLIRVGIAGILRREADIEVCGEAATIAQAMKLIEICQPDAVSVDITLAGESGIDLVSRIHAYNPEIGIFIYTMHDKHLWMSQAMEAGAKAYVRKMESPEILIKTIRLLAQHER